MKTGFTIIIGAVTIAVAGAVFFITRGFNSGRRLTHVSNEGYETAHDILYPDKFNKESKLHFGPVIPQD